MAHLSDSMVKLLDCYFIHVVTLECMQDLANYEVQGCVLADGDRVVSKAKQLAMVLLLRK